MIKTIFYVGLNDKDSLRQEIDSVTAFKMIQKLVLNYTGGATLSVARGIYTMKSGDPVVEEMIRVECDDFAPACVGALVGDIKKTLNQESVLVEYQKIERAFL